MKHAVEGWIHAALARLQAEGALAVTVRPNVVIERTRDARHGDFACNVALTLAKETGQRPRALAERIVNALPRATDVDRVEVAGPGFINFFVSDAAYHAVMATVLEEGEHYGRSVRGAGRSVLVEFVSANPTGPLHVGHGRGVAYGASLANLLELCGYRVEREYYVNDAGRQMDILATSVYLRYLELCGEEVRFPANGYQGDYVWDFAASLHREAGARYRHPCQDLLRDIPADQGAGGDKEAHIDALVVRTKAVLGAQDYGRVHELALTAVISDIRQDLRQIGVEYDRWFSERSLNEAGTVTRALERLRAAGHLYEKGGAQWFRSAAFGDEKDRVVVRENGQVTYFASDIAYHLDKLERGYDHLINVWGADHHGYVARLRGALQALGKDPATLTILLVQFAILYRGGKKVPMSTRTGEFVTLRELRQEVGADATRFFYVMRRCEQHLDFDLDLAKSQSSDNPVYYIQYAHARICSVLRQLREKGLARDRRRGAANVQRLVEKQERLLMTRLSRYCEVIEAAGMSCEPHQVAHYLRDLANELHVYYNAHQFLVEEPALRDARLNLIEAVRQVLQNGLSVLGVSAPASM